MKKFVFIGSAFLSCSVSAQEVVATQGDSYTSSNASIDFTVGEAIIQTVSDGNYELTQGFHQTHWYFVGMEDLAQSIQMEVFPNPMSNDLEVRCASCENTRYVFYDAQGKIVLEGHLEGGETKITVGHFAPGAYSLQLLSEETPLKTFKLVKNQ